MEMEGDERSEELEALVAIYPELTVDARDGQTLTASIDIAISPTVPLLIRFVPISDDGGTAHHSMSATKAHVEHDRDLSHLPPLHLRVSLAATYPSDTAPVVRLSTKPLWLPRPKIAELETDIVKLWDDYGRCQILFAYIDHLQQAAERGFDLDQSANGCLTLPLDLEPDLTQFDLETKQQIFAAGTYECGVCLDPKKGTMCYKMRRCGHVFCRQCLQDYYNNAISEGDISGVKCMDPQCGNGPAKVEGRKGKRKERLVHPIELLDMGVGDSAVRRFVEMKRKKRLEADKSTVYCPRTWCQGAAKSTKYPAIPDDLRAYVEDDYSSDEEPGKDTDSVQAGAGSQAKLRIPPDPADRLAVCEKCSFAFCQVCYMGWHGPFARCYPRDPNELSAEEKASYEYIRLHTSPCAYCNVPVQKTMGCNHMRCFQCNTHFCYLCGAWLEPGNPYQHFNKEGTRCFQRLWELEEGDEGQGPRDGHGFAGGRGWEQMAIDAAREAEEAEDAAAAAQLQANEEQANEPARPIAQEIDAPNDDEIPLALAMAHVHLGAQAVPAVAAAPRDRRRQRNPFPARNLGAGVAQAVRNHEAAFQRAPGQRNT